MLENLFQIDGIPLKFKICLTNKKLKRHISLLIKVIILIIALLFSIILQINNMFLSFFSQEHGGDLTDKYSKDIVLLCPEDYILKTDNCYSYTFIYDSIEAEKLKNKEDYKQVFYKITFIFLTIFLGSSKKESLCMPNTERILFSKFWSIFRPYSASTLFQKY